MAPFAALTDGASVSLAGFVTVISASVSFLTSAKVKAPDNCKPPPPEPLILLVTWLSCVDIPDFRKFPILNPIKS